MRSKLFSAYSVWKYNKDVELESLWYLIISLLYFYFLRRKIKFVVEKIKFLLEKLKSTFWRGAFILRYFHAQIII